jgi:hypothetical protein
MVKIDPIKEMEREAHRQLMASPGYHLWTKLLCSDKFVVFVAIVTVLIMIGALVWAI